MKCPLCGLVFQERDAQAACAGCIVAKKCGLIRCPNCGYEMTPERKPREQSPRKDPTTDAIDR